MIVAGDPRRPQYPGARWEAAGGGCDWVTRCSATSRVIMAAVPVPATIRMIPAGGLRRPQYPGARWKAAGGGCDWVTPVLSHQQGDHGRRPGTGHHQDDPGRRPAATPTPRCSPSFQTAGPTASLWREDFTCKTKGPVKGPFGEQQR